MNLLIVDDEALARSHLNRLIQQLGPPYRVFAEADNAEQALMLCQKNNIDLVLLDIEMPGMNGLQLARSLAELESPPAIILITAYPDYALSAFNTLASAYLLKPVRLSQLKQALQKLNQLQKTLPKMEKDYFIVRYRNKTERIPFSSIYYFHADHKYTVIRHQEGEALIETSLKQIEERFGDRVLRIHRSTLVVTDKIKGWQKEAGQAVILFQDIADRPEISRRHLASVRQFFDH